MDANTPTDAAEVMEAIGQAPPMYADELRECLDVLGWSQRELARQSKSDETNIRQMARGKRAIPDELARWVRILTAIHRALPLPANWRNGDDQGT